MTNEEAIELLKREFSECRDTISVYAEKRKKAFDMAIRALEQKPKCIWIKYDYRTICPKECGGKNPYWAIPENLENLKYCPYCGREIEVEQ